jgi:uncharacterized protein (DUF4415 family)
MSKVSKRLAIVPPSPEEDAEILAAAKADPDAQPLTDRQLAAMVPLRALRGRPKTEKKKVLLSVRYSPEVVAFFRATGEGWQSRMDSVLKDYVTRNSPLTTSRRRGQLPR